MDVTKENFKDNFQLISSAISDASVLAIDGEFTGLGAPDQAIHAFDTPEERYQKCRKGAMDYLLVQFGLCAFHYDEALGKYVAKAFNFYVFPKPFTRQAPDVRFLCQSSSIDFLCSQNFDFNKVFKQGIGYLRPAEEQRLRDALQQRHQAAERSERAQSSPAFASPVANETGTIGAKGPVVVPPERKQFVADICKRIEDFQTSDSTCLALEPTNGFLRMLTYQTISTRFKCGLHTRTRTDEKKRRYIELTKVGSEEEERRKEEGKRAAEHQELDDAVGFGKVIKLISQSGKLVVGHNMLLDLMHILHQFVGPLSEDYDEFKDMTRCCFPRLLDTKHMASSPPFKDQVNSTALDELVVTMDSPPFVKPAIVCADGFPNYTTADTDKLHTASYDAFVTGVCYLTMANHIGSLQKPPKQNLPADSTQIQPFANKIFLMRIYDIPFMNLKGKDLPPCRDHIFHLQFPKEWRATDITQLFSPFGNVQIVWLNDTAALVGLYRRDQAAFVRRTLRNGENYLLTTYDQYRKTMAASVVKRKVTDNDLDLPVKRKCIDAGIVTADDPDKSAVNSNRVTEVVTPKQTHTPAVSTSEDLGVPTNRTSEVTSSVNNDKLFDESDTW